MIVVSACLAGIPCRYNKTAKPNKTILRLVENHQAIPACPECMAGIKRPTLPAEIVGGDGNDVLNGRAVVYNKNGEDVTRLYIDGAEKMLQFTLRQEARKVLLKSKSPSCGVTRIYDGSFSGNLIDGCGVTAAILQENDIEIVEIP